MNLFTYYLNFSFLYLKYCKKKISLVNGSRKMCNVYAWHPSWPTRVCSWPHWTRAVHPCADRPERAACPPHPALVPRPLYQGRDAPCKKHLWIHNLHEASRGHFHLLVNSQELTAVYLWSWDTPYFYTFLKLELQFFTRFYIVTMSWLLTLLDTFTICYR